MRVRVRVRVCVRAHVCDQGAQRPQQFLPACAHTHTQPLALRWPTTHAAPRPNKCPIFFCVKSAKMRELMCQCLTSDHVPVAELQSVARSTRLPTLCEILARA
jgi:hypothetical protein